MFTDLHYQEERDFGRGPILWDADPTVCCAAFQLGACVHTEAFDEVYDLDANAFVSVSLPARPAVDDEPF